MSRTGSIIIRHWKGLVAYNLVILALASFGTSLVKKTWNANAKVILPNTSKNLNVKLGTVGDLNGGEGLVFSQQLDSRRILTSIALSDEVLKQTWNLDTERDRYSKLEYYRKLFTVKPDDASTVISVSAQGDTQELAKARLSHLVKILQARLNELRKDNATQQTESVQQELGEAEKRLDQAQKNLVQFQQKSNWIDSDSQTKELVATLRELVVAQAQAKAKAKASQAKFETLSQQLGQTTAQAIPKIILAENVEYQAIQQDLAKLEVELAEVRSLFTENSPQIRVLLDRKQNLLQRQNAQFGLTANASPQSLPSQNPSTVLPHGQNYVALQKQLADADSEARGTQEQATQLEHQVAELKNSLNQTPFTRAQLANLQRQYNNAETVYNGFMAQVQATQVSAFSNYMTIQVLDQPESESLPTGPGTRPVWIGALMAAFFGSAAIVLLLESRNPLLTIADLQKRSIPILSMILQRKGHHSMIRIDVEPDLEFQRLASAVSLMPLHDRRLMIASAEAGEGKTYVTLGLATALLHLGFRVLIVDADFDRLQLTRQIGYYADITTNSHLKPVELALGLDLLSLALPSEKVAEFIARGSLESLLNHVQSIKEYDYVLVDTHAINLSNETTLMARIIPDLLMITTLGNNKRDAFLNGMQQTRRNQAHVLGLVINRADLALNRLLSETTLVNETLK